VTEVCVELVDVVVLVPLMVVDSDVFVVHAVRVVRLTSKSGRRYFWSEFIIKKVRKIKL